MTSQVPEQLNVSVPEQTVVSMEFSQASHISVLPNKQGTEMPQQQQSLFHCQKANTVNINQVKKQLSQSKTVASFERGVCSLHSLYLQIFRPKTLELGFVLF